MHIHLDIQQALKRYLTLLYGLTLGLGLVLAYFAFNQRPDMPTFTTTVPPLATTPTSSLTLESTQAHNLTPTARPAIPATPNEQTPSTLGVASGELRGVKVSLWHPWTGAAGIQLSTLLIEFNRTNRWGISVEATAYKGFGALDEAVEAGLIAGSLPDVIVDYGYQARRWDNSDMILDLNAYINDPLWGLAPEERADIYPRFWDEDLVTTDDPVDARRLAVPWYRSAYVLFYNQEWASELGFSAPPASPEDFRRQACAAAEAVAEASNTSIPGRGGWLITSQPGELLGWMYAFGAEILGSGASGYTFDTPEGQAAVAYLKELQESGCAWFDPQSDPQVEFASRGALFVVGSLQEIRTLQGTLDDAGSADEWAVIPFPSRKQPAIVTYGPSLMVTRSNPAEQLAAWLVIDWLVYPPNQAEWVQTLQTYPTRMSALTYLDTTENDSLQWTQAFDLLPNARSEPALASWNVMRWALQDATSQLFDPKFTSDQVPSLLEMLDNLALEVAEPVK